MSEQRKSDSHSMVSEKERRERLIQQVSLVTLGLFVVFTVMYTVAWRTIPGFPQFC
jgi:cytoskeletal protein RodZ